MNPHATRRKNIFDPKDDAPFALSRSKVDLFLRCPRCFYLDRRLGVSEPRGFPFTLNNAVDTLLKKEFDSYREKGEPHPLVSEAGLALTPMRHRDLDSWRDPFVGVRRHHPESNFLVFGGIDDAWVDADGTLYVADYKATSKEGTVTLNAPWQRSYKNQIEMYQWLFRGNDLVVSDTGYFVYTNADTSRDSFGDTLHFETLLIPYTGSDEWIAGTLSRIREVLSGDAIPEAGRDCEMCPYRDAAGKSFRDHILP